MAHPTDKSHPHPRIDDRDWTQLTLGQRIQHLEVEGYVILPERMDPAHIARLKEQVAPMETIPADYSDNQRVAARIQFAGGAVSDLIAYPPTIEFLKVLFGDEIVMMSYDYARSEPGHPGISLHCDGQPWGSHIFAAEYTCPKLIRVLYYLDDLTPEVSPFKVIPRSHLSYHNEANPYLRYETHPEEVMVTCRAGSILLIDNCVFHGNFANTGTYARDALQLSYRPSWAGPMDDVEPWDPEEVAKLPPVVQAFMGARSGRIWIPEGGNKPAGMRSEAPGMDPSRWDRE